MFPIGIEIMVKEYIARFGHGSAKLARQAQSKEKTMAKMVAGGLTEKVVLEQTKQVIVILTLEALPPSKIQPTMLLFSLFKFYFFEPDTIPLPVIMVQHVSFRYNPDSVIAFVLAISILQIPFPF